MAHWEFTYKVTDHSNIVYTVRCRDRADAIDESSRYRANGAIIINGPYRVSTEEVSPLGTVAFVTAVSLIIFVLLAFIGVSST